MVQVCDNNKSYLCVSLFLSILGVINGFMPAKIHRLIIAAFPILMTQIFLSGPELKLELDKKSRPMWSPRPSFYVSMVCRMNTCKDEISKYMFSVHICFY